MTLLRPLLPACPPLFAATAHAEKVTVAAASDLKFAMDGIITVFRQVRPADEVEVTCGSSDTFRAQIRNGTPWDLHVSADIQYAQSRVDAGFAASEVKS